jgi:hypothetical protein
MTEGEKVVPIKRSLADETRGQVAIAASHATETDHKAVAELVKRATGAPFSNDIVTLTPPMSALLFLNHNSHNRPWNPSWTLELARRMRAKLWKKNSMSVGFYVDGLIEDMQHRAAAAAIADYPLTVPCVFGIEKDAVDTIDAGKRRSGADHAGLDGIIDAVRKQQIIKAAAAYFVRAGDSSAALKSEAEVKTAIEQNDAMLAHAIEIGEHSRSKIAGGGVLKAAAADTFGYIGLKTGRTADAISNWLDAFQTGQSTLGEHDPMFVSAQVIERRRKRSAGKEKLNTTKEIGIAVFALLQTEHGVKSVQERHVKAAVDGKTVPDPRYTGEAAEEAA